MSLFSPEMYEQNRRAQETQLRLERERQQQRNAIFQQRANEVNAKTYLLADKESALDTRAKELAARERAVAKAEQDFFLKKSAFEEQQRSEIARKRYFGFAPHNTTADRLLYLTIRQEYTMLGKEVRQLPLLNDFELPAYLQEGVYAHPTNGQLKISLTPFEAALWLEDIPSLKVFHADILKRIENTQINDKYYIQFLRDALAQIGESESFEKKPLPELVQFFNDLLSKFVVSTADFVGELRKAGIFLPSLGNTGKSNENSTLTTNFPRYWMVLPQLVINLAPEYNKLQAGPIKNQAKNILDDMINIYLDESFAFLKKRRETRQEGYKDLNLAVIPKSHHISSKWEHYVHHPSSGATFDLEGNQISGEIGQRYHDLRFDAHTGQLFNQDGEEVELVGPKIPQMSQMLRKAVTRVTEGESGTSKNFTYNLFVNKEKKNGVVSLPKGGSIVVVQGGTENRGMIETRGAKQGFLGKRGAATRVRYPALLLIDNSVKPTKTHVVAYTKIIGPNMTMFPHSSSKTNSIIVKKFWKDVGMFPFIQGGGDEGWVKHLTNKFTAHFGTTNNSITSEIGSSSCLVSRPFCESDVFEREENEDLETYASSSSSSSSSSNQISALEQF